jgi:cytochrome c5
MPPERNLPAVRLLLALALVVALAACGRDVEQTASAAPDSTGTSSALPAPGPSPALAAAIDASERSSADALPTGAAKDLVRSSCLTCHSASMISQQHKDAAAWDKTVTKMVAWGAPLSDDRKDELIAYLVANFGSRGAPATP